MVLPDFLAVDLGGSEPSTASLSPIARVQFRPAPENPEPLETMDGSPLSSATTMLVHLRPPTRDGDYTVTGEVIDELGRSNFASTRFAIERGQARTIDPMDEHASWIERAIVYGAAPFLFGRPGFSAVRDRLDELSELGIDTVWLSPVTASPEGDYGYAVVDYLGVRDEYGTTSDFHGLISRAHELGMRVLMDFVPSHTSDQHPYYAHAVEHGVSSPYWDFYARDATGEAQYDFDWTHLPKLNYDHPEVRRWMNEAFSFWVREFDIDGFRVDAAWSLEHRAPEFLVELAENLYAMNPDLLLIAEARACDPFWENAGFAAGYDWTNTIGRWAWHAPFRIDEDTTEVDVPALRTALETSHAAHCVRVVRFLDNNDTGARFITRRGHALYDAALTLLFTLPGLPTLFTGAEIGAEYSPYERETPLTWQRDSSYAHAIEQRIALRRSLTALHRGDLVMLQVTPADSVLAFLRHEPNEGHPVLVAINFSEARQLVRVSLPEADMPSFASRPLYDAMSDEAISSPRARTRELMFSLDSYQARVISSRP
jgi:glycosidase